MARRRAEPARAARRVTPLALFAIVLLGTLALGRPLIRTLRALSVRQTAYEDAPKSHASKSGTPTMGGILFLFGLLAALAVRHDAATVALVVLGAGMRSDRLLRRLLGDRARP